MLEYRPADRLTGRELLADLDRRRAENLNRPAPGAAMPVWEPGQDWQKNPIYGTHDASGRAIPNPGPRLTP